MNANKLLLSALAAATLASSAVAGPKFEYNDGKSSLELFQMVQFWGMTAVDDDNDDIADPNDLYVRRGRFGARGAINPDVSYTVWFAYDMIGKDGNDFMIGSPQDNTNSNKDVYIWDAMVTYKMNKEFANVTLGYFRPQVGKESITSGFHTTSYEKGLSNFFVRTHLVGRGPGREMGVNVGGLTLGNKLNYNFGLFNPNHTGITGATMKTGTNQTGTVKENAFMFAGRVAYSIGDAEMDKYKISYTTNYFGKRNGVTLAVEGAMQGETDKFESNTYYGFDVLANFGQFNASYEHNFLSRTYTDEQKAVEGFKFQDSDDVVMTAHASYNFPIAEGKQFIEPAVMWTRSDLDEGSYFGLASGYSNGTKGNVTIYSAGVNWYKDKMKEKYGIHFANFDKSEDMDGKDGAEQSVVTLTAQFIF
ncbi:MAG: hypothetical protein JXK05_01220 [Campylobacterales bacterium]|nr:hypothetical protein [Campylobacterales bacterium]